MRTIAAAPRDIVRFIRRDPEHFGERLILYATAKLDGPAQEWADAQKVETDADRHALAAAEARKTRGIARVDGAVAGTPFFIALVPAYIAYLWQEARMILRIAALYGHDPASDRVAAEMAVLRGLRPTIPAAEASLDQVRATPLPPAPEHRRPVRTWYESVRRVLVVAGFLSAPDDEEKREPASTRSRLIAAGRIAIGGAIWVGTWVFPVTFMVVMSWGCESDARKMGRRTLEYYGGSEALEAAIAKADSGHDAGRTWRQAVRAGLVTLSVAASLVLLALTVSDAKRHTLGLPTWLASLVGLTLVLGIAGAAARR